MLKRRYASTRLSQVLIPHVKGAVMVQRGKTPAHLSDLAQINLRRDDTGVGTGFGENVAPRPHNEAVTIGLAAIGLRAALSGRHDKAAVLDGSGPQQHVPMGLTGRLRKGGRNGEDFRAVLG